MMQATQISVISGSKARVHSVVESGEMISIVWAHHIVTEREVERVQELQCGFALRMAVVCRHDRSVLCFCRCR